MKTSMLSFVPLQQASLCLDCDMITAAHTHCSACGSIALLNLARTLNSEEDHQMLAADGTMDSTAQGRSFDSISLSDMFPRRPHRGMTERPFSERSTTVPQTSNAPRWQSFREAAALVHRAMTIAIIGILVRGACTPVWGRSREFAGTGGESVHAYSAAAQSQSA